MGHGPAVEILLAHGAHVEQGKHHALYAATSITGSADAVRALLAAGVDADSRTDEGFTALMHAASFGQTESVRVLLAAGADVNAEDQHARSPLKSAIVYGDADMVEAMLAAGAIAKARNSDGGARRFPTLLRPSSHLAGS